MVAKMNLLMDPELTVNVLLVPECPLPSFVEIEMPEPALESVTEPVHTPATNAPVLVGLIVPAEADKVFVPV